MFLITLVSDTHTKDINNKHSPETTTINTESIATGKNITKPDPTKKYIVDLTSMYNPPPSTKKCAQSSPLGNGQISDPTESPNTRNEVLQSANARHLHYQQKNVSGKHLFPAGTSITGGISSAEALRKRNIFDERKQDVDLEKLSDILGTEKTSKFEKRRPNYLNVLEKYEAKYASGKSGSVGNKQKKGKKNKAAVKHALGPVIESRFLNCDRNVAPSLSHTSQNELSCEESKHNPLHSFDPKVHIIERLVSNSALSNSEKVFVGDTEDVSIEASFDEGALENSLVIDASPANSLTNLYRSKNFQPAHHKPYAKLKSMSHAQGLVSTKVMLQSNGVKQPKNTLNVTTGNKANPLSRVCPDIIKKTKIPKENKDKKEILNEEISNNVESAAIENKKRRILVENHHEIVNDKDKTESEPSLKRKNNRFMKSGIIDENKKEDIVYCYSINNTNVCILDLPSPRDDDDDVLDDEMGDELSTSGKIKGYSEVHEIDKNLSEEKKELNKPDVDQPKSTAQELQSIQENVSKPELLEYKEVGTIANKKPASDFSDWRIPIFKRSFDSVEFKFNNLQDTEKINQVDDLQIKTAGSGRSELRERFNRLAANVDQISKLESNSGSEKPNEISDENVSMVSSSSEELESDPSEGQCSNIELGSSIHNVTNESIDESNLSINSKEENKSVNKNEIDLQALPEDNAFKPFNKNTHIEVNVPIYDAAVDVIDVAVNHYENLQMKDSGRFRDVNCEYQLDNIHESNQLNIQKPKTTELDCKNKDRNYVMVKGGVEVIQNPVVAALASMPNSCPLSPGQQSSTCCDTAYEIHALSALTWDTDTITKADINKDTSDEKDVLSNDTLSESHS